MVKLVSYADLSQISDLAFRRHILVQALILIDFLLSLTPKEKAKLAELNLQNKSVQYQYTLGDDDVGCSLTRDGLNRKS